MNNINPELAAVHKALQFAVGHSASAVGTLTPASTSELRDKLASAAVTLRLLSGYLSFESVTLQRDAGRYGGLDPVSDELRTKCDSVRGHGLKAWRQALDMLDAREGLVEDNCEQLYDLIVDVQLELLEYRRLMRLWFNSNSPAVVKSRALLSNEADYPIATIPSDVVKDLPGWIALALTSGEITRLVRSIRSCRSAEEAHELCRAVQTRVGERQWLRIGGQAPVNA